MSGPLKRRAIQAGWESYRRAVVPADAGEVQLKETRQAYFAGAATLFTAIMNALGPGEEPTEADLAMMQALQDELDEFGAELDRRYLGGGGSH